MTGYIKLETIGKMGDMISHLEQQNKLLQKKLTIAVKALKDALRNYEINGPCEEDCVGYYMYFIILRALKETEEE